MIFKAFGCPCFSFFINLLYFYLVHEALKTLGAKMRQPCFQKRNLNFSSRIKMPKTDIILLKFKRNNNYYYQNQIICHRLSIFSKSNF